MYRLRALLFLAVLGLLVPGYQENKNEKESEMYKKYEVAKVKYAVKLDGKWDEGVWENVASLEVKHFMGAEPEHKPKMQAKVLYDDESVHVMFRVEDKYVRAVAENYHDAVCLDSCAEFFFTPGDDLSLGYFNFEINCGGTMLASHQLGRGEEVKPLGRADCERIAIYHSMPKIVEPEIQEPTTWIIQYRLPFDVLEKYCAVKQPGPGVAWKANFYKCADETSKPHWLTWSVIDKRKPDFHVPEFFGTLEFK